MCVIVNITNIQHIIMFVLFMLQTSFVLHTAIQQNAHMFSNVTIYSLFAYNIVHGINRFNYVYIFLVVYLNVLQ